MLRMAKRNGWETLLKYGKKLDWLKLKMRGWFDVLGMFEKYNQIGA